MLCSLLDWLKECSVGLHPEALAAPPLLAGRSTHCSSPCCQSSAARFRSAFVSWVVMVAVAKAHMSHAPQLESWSPQRRPGSCFQGLGFLVMIARRQLPEVASIWLVAALGLTRLWLALIVWILLLGIGGLALPLRCRATSLRLQPFPARSTWSVASTAMSPCRQRSVSMRTETSGGSGCQSWGWHAGALQRAVWVATSTYLEGRTTATAVWITLSASLQSLAFPPPRPHLGSLSPA
mmetsp:Transcript_54132/g.150183  ORF Transcript_54132/g.150183 Transcript_54132/m.150183 type:complete len:237 (-) Transcript_54132:431-1141(-)